MKNSLRKAIGGILLFVSFGLVVYVGFGIKQGGRFDSISIIITGVEIGLPLILGTVLLVVGIANKTKKKQIVSFMEYVVFTTYILFLLAILFLGGRGDIHYESMRQYYRDYVNLIPFRTILDYINHFTNHTMNKDTIIFNLIGNFIIFMPFGVLLPCMFKKFRTRRVFILSIALILCGVELLQLLTTTGSLDIDDFILNMSGTCFAFAIMRNGKVISLCERMYLRK